MQSKMMSAAVHNFIQDMDRRQRIARAVAFAECGRPCRALAIIEAVPPSARHAEEWDMMARLLTGMSRFREARDAWEQAGCAGMSPKHVRKVISALDARRHITLVTMVLFAAFCAVAMLLALLVFLSIFS